MHAASDYSIMAQEACDLRRRPWRHGFGSQEWSKVTGIVILDARKSNGPYRAHQSSQQRHIPLQRGL